MRILSLLLLLLTISCSSPKIKNEKTYEKIDSIIQNSEVNIIRSDSVNRESEKSVVKKIGQTVNKIEGLKEEVSILKQEVETAKMMVKTVYKIDTVYIETKKNFWGKEKTNTKVISDSLVVEDSLNNKN
jgi:predicted nucleic-acid-binding protein